jgi:tetratricopeptide (TPR) repeat protein
MLRSIGIVPIVALLLSSSIASASSREAVERVAAGKKFLDQGKVESAIFEFQKAVSIDPTYGAAQLNLGQAYERVNQSDNAIDAYRKTIELEPKNFYAHNNLGVLYDKNGRYDEAIAEFKGALKNDPNNAIALKNLETAKKNKVVVQERDAVIARAEKDAEAKPNDPNPAYQMARVYATYGNKEAAIEWLGKAIQKGYKDFAYLKADPAFVSLHEIRDFQLLLVK